MYGALKMSFFINFQHFLCLDGFHDPIRVISENLSFDFSELLGTQVIRLFVRTYFEFWDFKNKILA